MPHTLLVAPAGRNVGLTTVCLGLVRALDRQGVRVAFVKPITTHGQDRSVPLMKAAARVSPPEPLPRNQVEELLASGNDQTLMELVVAMCKKAAEGADVLLVEGMVPETGMLYSSRVNALMMRALDAELVLVASPRDQSPAEIADAVSIAARGYGPLAEGETVACVLNRVCTGPSKKEYGADNFGPLASKCSDCEQVALGADADAHRKALEAEKLRPLGVVACNRKLAALRVKDIGETLGAKVLNEGDSAKRRAESVLLCAMTAPNAIKHFKAGVLAIVPSDRNDIILAAASAAQGGTALSGLLLTDGLNADQEVLALCKPALKTGLPVLAVTDSSYTTATKVQAVNPEIRADDLERIETSANYVAEQIDAAWVKSLSGTARTPRLSPPAFRHRLIEASRAANKRIVLPEGAEPRTVAAAAIAQERGIARCVLLGNPDEIREAAKKQGVTLPKTVEIIDAAKAAPKYVDPLVERRKHKGMTVEMAQKELSDTIMVGTMMMALDEADGLVSGAVHTTAHTIRPALQIIKTVPGCSQVSSVFFMCLPDQVLVFGDCAVIPNPTAEVLAEIAIQSADSAAAFGIPPRVAMLSYSTGASGTGDEVEKVKKATALAQKARPDLAIDGPLQYDAAIMPDVARSKAPKSPVAGKATVFVFPDLNTGNVTYKAVQRSANALAIGPMLQGMAKPVNDLSRGCLIEDIVFTIALTAIQAKQVEDRMKKGKK